MNNKVCKEYIREIKTIFPVKSKQEREYIKNLSNDIADFCEQQGITSKEELYNNYGSPIDVVSQYFSATGIPYVFKKIRTGKYIKRLIAVVLILALISTVTYCIVLHEDHQITKRQEAVIAEDVIEQYKFRSDIFKIYRPISNLILKSVFFVYTLLTQ